MSARYRAGSVTGYPIEPEGLGVYAPETTIWYVHDTGDQYRIVKSFKGYRNGERSARELAALLNADDANPAPPHPGPTHCKHGHRWDLVNTYLDRKGARVCRTCRAEWQREFRAREARARV